MPRQIVSPRPTPVPREDARAIEPLEDMFLFARHQPQATVGDVELHVRADDPGRERDFAAVGRAADGIFQQVCQHLLNQERIERHQRQVGRQVSDDFMALQTARKSVQYDADHLFDDLPFLVDLQRPASSRVMSSRFTTSRLSRSASSKMDSASSCRVAGSSPLPSTRVLLRRRWQPAACASRATRRPGASCAGHPASAWSLACWASWAERMRSAAKATCPAKVSSSRICSDEKRLDRSLLLGRHARMPTIEPRRLERNEQGRRRGERVGAAAGLAIVEDPLRDAQVMIRERPKGIGRRSRADGHGAASRGIGKQQKDFAVEDLANMLHGQIDQDLRRGGLDQPTTHRIQGRRALLALAGGLGLKFDMGGEGADHQAGDQHHGERDQVLGIADREGQPRRDKEEIEGANAQDRGHDRRSAPKLHGHGDHAQQIDHDDVREREALLHQPAGAGACGDREQAQPGTPTDERGPERHARVRRALLRNRR